MTTETRQRLTHIIRAVRSWRGGRKRREQLLSILCQWAQWEGLAVSDAQVKARARRVFRRPPSRRRRWHCLDCGLDTIVIGEYPYNLRDDLWNAIVPGGRGMLCLDCLEVRLGRPLRKNDFGR